MHGRYFLRQVLQSFQHRTLIGQRLFNPIISLGSFRLSNHRSNGTTLFTANRMEYSFHMLTHSDSRVQARRFLSLYMDFQLWIV